MPKKTEENKDVALLKAKVTEKEAINVRMAALASGQSISQFVGDAAIKAAVVVIKKFAADQVAK